LAQRELGRSRYIPVIESTQYNPPPPARLSNVLEERIMKKLAMLSSILLLSAVCAVAQYGSQDNSQNNPSSASSSASSGSMTVQGCLSGADGNYTLTDKSGTAYNLTGDTSRLQAHVGHTISVTGMTSSSGSTSGQSGSMSSPSDSSHPSLMVSSFKHVSPTCNMASQ
jgi:hypothetical protein